MCEARDSIARLSLVVEKKFEVIRDSVTALFRKLIAIEKMLGFEDVVKNYLETMK